MKVSDAIARLSEFDGNAELHFCTEHGSSLGFTNEVDNIYDSTAQYGILTSSPVTVSIVVLDSSFCGL